MVDMEMYNANGEGKPLEIILTQQETEELVLKKYQKVETHPVRENRKRGVSK